MRDVSSIASRCVTVMLYPCAMDVRGGYHARVFGPAPSEKGEAADAS